MKTSIKAFMQTAEVTQYLRDNYCELTSTQMAAHLHVGRTNVRTRCYELGLLRQELEYWTAEQVEELRTLYTTHGDLEIAALFQQKHPKRKGWTKKHIEKKRKQLGLQRSPETLQLIHARFLGKEVVERGHAFKSRAGVGEQRVFHSKTGRVGLYEKTPAGRWVPAGRLAWKRVRGPVPAGHKIRFLDGNPCHCELSNLALTRTSDIPRLTRSGSRELSDKYVAAMLVGTRSPLPRPERQALRQAYLAVPELLELQRHQLRLGRALKHAQE